LSGLRDKLKFIGQCTVSQFIEQRDKGNGKKTLRMFLSAADQPIRALHGQCSVKALLAPVWNSPVTMPECAVLDADVSAMFLPFNY
jgi:hypothetical protein